MSLIDDIERIGAKIEGGTDRREAIHELCDLFEQFPAGRDIDFWSAGDLLDDWRHVRVRYEAVKGVSSRELRQLEAVASIESDAARRRPAPNGRDADA